MLKLSLPLIASFIKCFVMEFRLAIIRSESLFKKSNIYFLDMSIVVV